MSRKSKARLAENSYVKELLTVLKENPSPSSQDFMEMVCLLYTSPSPRDVEESRMPSSA